MKYHWHAFEWETIIAIIILAFCFASKHDVLAGVLFGELLFFSMLMVDLISNALRLIVVWMDKR